jgi:selenocysteine lyase/cysteine desulfurase
VATIQTAADWQKEWFEIADATYLNTAAHAAIPRVALHAVQSSIEANKSPHHMDDAVFFEAPSRIRASLSKMIGAKPEEIALTTGASTGVAAVAQFLRWKPGDEVITAKGEFPLQYATWKPMEERHGVKLKTVAFRRVRWTPQSAGLTAVSPRGVLKRPPSSIRSCRRNMLWWRCEGVRSASHPICSIQSGTSTA